VEIPLYIPRVKEVILISILLIEILAMPLYDYFCPSNDQKIEVMHSINQKIATWGELCQLAKCDRGDTPEDAPVQRLISVPRLMVPTSDSDYKSLGMTKLVKRDRGVYENVTAKDGESRIVGAQD